MENATSIGNVNILDLTQATPESLAAVKSIGNVNVALVTRETAPLLARIRLGNINTSLEIPTDASVQQHIGQTVINRDYFQNLSSPVFLVCVGQVIIEPDVPPQAFDQGITRLACVGQLLCPAGLMGLVLSKARNVIGQSKAYPALAQVKIDSFTLDLDALNALADHSELAVLDSLTLPQVLPDDLLAQKLAKVYVLEHTICHAENAALLQSRLMEGSGRLTLIPAGFAYVEKALTLDSSLLAYLPSPRLYCTERLVISADVDARALDEKLEAVQCRELVLCPAALKPVLAKKCSLFDTRVTFYEGELWLVDDSSTLFPARFEALQGKATLVVSGELRLDPSVSPALLSGRLAKIHNYGVIACNPDQLSAVHALLGVNEGDILDSSAAEREPEELGGIGNINYLAL